MRGDPWGSAWAAAGHLALGAPLVGLGLGAVLGAVAWGLAFARRSPSQERPPYRLPESAPAWVKAVERVASRFLAPDSPSPRERTQFHYVRYKLLTDPIARLVVARAERLGGEAPLGDVLDVGAGRGQLALLLVELGLAKRAHGVDWDPRKVSEGLRAASGERTRESSLPLPPLAVTLDAGDARSAELPPADTVLLIDLLHYFGVPEQDALLARAARAVRAGGRLFVREACSERGWRSWVTRAEEALFTALRWNRGERVCFRSSRELAARLEAEGLTVTVEPAWGKTPFSNVLLVGVRGASPRAPG